jgi:hypothetical protein
MGIRGSGELRVKRYELARYAAFSEQPLLKGAGGIKTLGISDNIPLAAFQKG